MKCGACNRDNLSKKELALHIKFFHSPKQPPQRIVSGACPECGSTLWYQEGCANCPTCGYSKCG